MENKMAGRLLVSAILIMHFSVQAQHQLLLVSGDRVIHRFKQGETLRTKWLGSTQEHWGFIMEVNEFDIITSQDTLDIRNIRKVLLPGRPVVNKIGKMLIVAGTAYFVIDQFNWTVVQGNDPSMDDSVWKPASILVGVGIPLVLIRKNWKRTGGDLRLKTVEKSSRLYLQE